MTRWSERFNTAESPCFLIAEIGLNHNGDYDLAVRSIKAAAASGADAVKFQNFITEDFLTDRTITHTYRQGGKEITEPLYDICKRSEFKREWIAPLKALCDDLGVVFLSTPTSKRGVDDLVDNGVEFLKNGSDYLTHLPLLRYMSATGAWVVVSTGLAYVEDIDAAVEALAAHSERVILLHCVSNYPTNPENVNLRRMLSLKERYGLPVGFSDHTEGWEAAVQAVTMGAKVVEKHFTLDRSLPGPDHWFSSDPTEFVELADQVRRAEARMGSPMIEPAVGEREVLADYRLGVYALRDLSKGEFLKDADVIFRKPCAGLSPRELEAMRDQPLQADVKADEPIRPEAFGREEGQ